MSRELCGLRVRERPELRISAGRQILQSAPGVGIEDHIEPVAQTTLPHILVHDQRVRDLLLVEDHPHPAG